MGIKEIGLEGVDWIRLAEERKQWLLLVSRHFLFPRPPNISLSTLFSNTLSHGFLPAALKSLVRANSVCLYSPQIPDSWYTSACTLQRADLCKLATKPFKYEPQTALFKDPVRTAL